MTLLSTSLTPRTLALAAALALPGLAAAQQGPGGAVPAFAAKVKPQGLTTADLADPLIISSYFDSSTGLTHTYLQQRTAPKEVLRFSIESLGAGVMSGWLSGQSSGGDADAHCGNHAGAFEQGCRRIGTSLQQHAVGRGRHRRAVDVGR